MGFTAWRKKRKLERFILEAALFVRVVEERNKNLVKRKIGYWKSIRRIIKRFEIARFDPTVLRWVIEEQAGIFLKLKQLSINALLGKTSLTSIMADISLKITQGQDIIDSLRRIYDQQLMALRQKDFSTLEALLRQEFAVYKTYEQLRMTVPSEVLLELDAEWKKHSRKLRRGEQIPDEASNLMQSVFFSALFLGIIYLCVDDEQLKKILIRPEFISLYLAGDIAWTNYLKTEKKMLLFLRTIPKQKPIMLEQHI